MLDLYLFLILKHLFITFCVWSTMGPDHSNGYIAWKLTKGIKLLGCAYTIAKEWSVVNVYSK